MDEGQCDKINPQGAGERRRNKNRNPRVFINHLGSERVMVSDANDKCHAHHLPPEADHDTWSQAINTIQLIIAIIVINNRSQQQGEL